MSRSTFLASLTLLALLIAGNNAQYRRRQTECVADGEVGSCINARECHMVASILQQSREQAVSYLQRNHCGFDGSNPLVCCINVNTRPNGNPTPGIFTNPVNTPQPDVNFQVNLADNPLLPNDCGLDLTQKIFGGENTTIYEFPWMVLLEYQKPTGKTTLCGGVLINQRYIVTAAHCVKGKDLPPDWPLVSVRLGEYNTETEVDCIEDDNNMICADDPVTVGVEEQIAHEEYRPRSTDQRYDIALLRLTRDVAFTNFIKPICLPSNKTTPSKLVVAGWGKTETRSSSNVKLKLSVPLTNMEQCGQTYRNVGIQLGFGQICAGGQRGKDSCRGDSGGPLMAVERIADGSGRWTARGVVSFGPSPCGMPGWPGVYTKIADFVPWIVSKLRP